MTARWFDEQELQELSRPTMERAIEAIDRGDLDEARALCTAMSHEWRFLHDLMVEQVMHLVSFIQRRLGEQSVAEAWSESLERGWKRDTDKIVAADRRSIVLALAATWRAHSTSGTGAHPGSFTITEDEEKFTFAMNPCGSGQRLWRIGRYEGPNAGGLTTEAHDWSFGRENFPLYCTHCTFMNESLPLRWYGAPLYPLDPPDNFDRDPCVWYWYKDPDTIPERFRRRYAGASDHPPAQDIRS